MQGKPYKPNCLRSTARLLMQGQSAAYIGRLLHIDRCKVSNIRHILVENDVTDIDKLNALTDAELTHLVYPSAVIIADNITGEQDVAVLRKKESDILYPNFKKLAWQKIEQHCQINELYYAYQELCETNKRSALSRSTFFAGVKKVVDDITRGEDACLTIVHEYGHDIQVDYIDKYPTLTLGDGSRQEFVVFVMVWPASYYTFACFIPDHSTIQTCKAIGDGLKFFNARSFRLCPDNARSMVTSHKKGREAVLNPSFEDFMRRLGIDVQPTPVYSASSKSAVEYENRLIEERVFPHLGNDTRRTLQEWNIWLLELVNEKINRTKLHRTGKTREQLFLEYEKPAARVLDFAIPEYQEVVNSIRVPRTYMVEFDHHRYSVDHNLIGMLVDIRASATTVRIFYQNRQIAIYPRKSDNGFTILPEHMPEKHRAVIDQTGQYRTDEEVTQAASGLSEALLSYCQHRLSFGDTQRYVSCSATIRHYKKTLNTAVFDRVLLSYCKENERYRCDSGRILKDVSLELQRLALDAEQTAADVLPEGQRAAISPVRPSHQDSNCAADKGGIATAFSPLSEAEQARIDACVFSESKSYSEQKSYGDKSFKFDDEIPF